MLKVETTDLFLESKTSEKALTFRASRMSLYFMRARGILTFEYIESLAEGVI